MAAHTCSHSAAGSNEYAGTIHVCMHVCMYGTLYTACTVWVLCGTAGAVAGRPTLSSAHCAVHPLPHTPPVLHLYCRPPSAGPTWGRYLSGALATAVKLTLLNPPYMREAWRAEPRHSTHRGQHIDDLLHGSALGGTPLELQEAAICSSADGLSDGSDGAAVEAAERLLGGHVLPVYPSTAASFAPICTHVPTLVAGRAAGYEAVAQMLGVLAAAVAARAPLQ